MRGYEDSDGFGEKDELSILKTTLCNEGSE